MLLKDMILDEMERRNLNLHETARIVELRESKLQLYINGMIPSGKDLEKICANLKLDEDDIIYDEMNISTSECATLMQQSVLFVRNAVEKGKMPGLCQFAKCKEGNNDKRIFHIPRKAFMCYMEQWNTDNSLREEVKVLKQAMNDMSTVMNNMVSIISDLSNVIKNAPLRQDRAQDSIS